MDKLRDRKMEVARQLREAAWRIGREAKDMNVPLPISVKMVLAASDEDFLIAQHRQPTSAETVVRKIEEMECQLDELARAKLGATALRRDIHQVQDRPVDSFQSLYDATS